ETPERTLAVCAILYLLIRYGVSWVFKNYTVHRGMFHSIPALLISGLVVFVFWHSQDLIARIYLAGGTMVGFLSHLVLDEIYSVKFMGGTVRLIKYAGSALKFWSSSWPASVATYILLTILATAAAVEASAVRK